MGEFALVGYSVAAVLFAVLSGMLATLWRGRLTGGLLLLASLITALWAGTAALQAGFRAVPVDLLWALEVVRNLAWLAVLFRLLSPFAERNPVYFAVLRYLQIGIFLLGVVLLFSLVDIDWIDRQVQFDQFESELRLVVHLMFAVVGMGLVEQLFRNAPTEQRWSIKYFCLGLGTLFVFDFYLYTDALLFHRVDLAAWSARGVVAAMIVPMLGMAAARNPRLDLPVVMSRRMVFHTTTLFAAGVYMLLMAMAGYYIRFYGGDWGSALQIAFVTGALLFLLAALLSGKVRAQAKVFLNKHFFNYQYDYRDEWLRLIGLLTGRKSGMPLGERVIWALGEIVESDGGVLFQCNEEGVCRCVAAFNHPDPKLAPLGEADPLVRFIAARQWIVDLDEYHEDPGVYDDMDLPDWLGLMRTPWLVVPLIHDEQLRGFVVLKQPRAPQEINWESMDLLKTSGMQAASYLTLNEAAEALAEARQFEGFNRLSAFVMHDLKNLIAQLSLVARNAAKHKHNPAFIDDAVRTIDNAVSKMNRLMEQLKTAGMSPEARVVDLVGLLRHLVDSRRGMRPEPTLRTRLERLEIMAEPDRLASVIGHIVQNAQDATPPDGRVELELRQSNDQAIVTVRDTGSGMDEEFLRNRLFRPFDSTKGLTGMGIGAYECREFVRAIGGQVEVESAPGRGTTFVILLPVAAGQASTSKGGVVERG